MNPNKPDQETINKIKAMKLCEKTLRRVLEYAKMLDTASKDLNYQFNKFMDFCVHCERYSDRYAGSRELGWDRYGKWEDENHDVHWDSCSFDRYHREALKPFFEVRRIIRDLNTYIEDEKMDLEIKRRHQISEDK